MNCYQVLNQTQEFELVRGLDLVGNQYYQDELERFDQTNGTGKWKKARNALAVLLMLEAGLRVKEVTELVYSDCYFNGVPVKTMVVRAEIAKGGRQRQLPISRRLDWALSWFRLFNEVAVKQINEDYLISRTKGGDQITTRAIEKMVSK